MGMEIKVFNDKELFPTPPSITTNASEIIKYHRKRQRRFISNCIRYHHSKQRSWTMFIDADEYLTFNPITDYDIQKHQNNNKQYHNLYSKNSNNDYVVTNNTISMERYLDILQKFGYNIPIPKNPKQKKRLNSNLQRDLKSFMQNINNRKNVPSNITQTIAEYIAQEQQTNNLKSKSCIVVPRVTFGTTLPNKIDFNEIYQQKYPIHGFDYKKFNTLQFFYNSYKGLNDKIDSPGKSFVDVSRLSNYTLTRNMSRCVHTIVNECGNGEMSAYAMMEESVFKIHHYSMSRDVHFAKNDPRRTTEVSFHKNLS